jgi:hypothetical protein
VAAPPAPPGLPAALASTPGSKGGETAPAELLLTASAELLAAFVFRFSGDPDAALGVPPAVALANGSVASAWADPSRRVVIPDGVDVISLETWLGTDLATARPFRDAASLRVAAVSRSPALRVGEVESIDEDGAATGRIQLRLQCSGRPASAGVDIMVYSLLL